MKTFIITTNSTRAAATLASVDALNPEIFQGSDASAWTKESEELRIIRGATTRPGLLYGQAGCTLSHVRIWKLVAEGTQPCLILEDDAVLTDDADLSSWPECDFLWLYGNPNPEKNPLPIGVSEYARLYNPGTVAYRLTPAGAKQLLACFANPLGFEGVQLPEAVDVALAGLLSSRRFAAKVLFPHPFRHEDGGDSTIRNGRYVLEPRAIAKATRAITKRELVDGLIELGKAEAFAALIGQLPIAERLRWEASPTVSPDYPFLVEQRQMLIAVLGITGDQLDGLFS